MGILSMYWALGVTAAIFMFGFASFGCFTVRAYFFTPARSAKFYENEFVIKGWRFKKRYKYSDIDSVEAYKLPVYFTIISLNIKGESKIFTLWRDVGSSFQNVRLAEWLNAKFNVKDAELQK